MRSIGLYILTHISVIERPLELPLAAHEQLMQRIVGGGVRIADAVEGGHESYRMAALGNCLEGLRIDLADGLLGRPGEDAALRVAVLFLIIEEHVLDVADDALGARRGDDRFCHLGGEDAVLRIVLEVAAGEGVAVNIDGGACPAAVLPQENRLVADQPTLLACELYVVGRRDDGRRGARRCRRAAAAARLHSRSSHQARSTGTGLVPPPYSTRVQSSSQVS